MRTALSANKARKQLSAKKTRSQSPQKDRDQDDVQAMLQRKLKRPYREGDRPGNPAVDLYASAGRNQYYEPSEQDEDHDNIVPFTPEKDIYTNSIRPYQPPQGNAEPASSPRRKKLSLKASKNRRKLDFFADEEEEDEEEEGDDAFDYYG